MYVHFWGMALRTVVIQMGYAQKLGIVWWVVGYALHFRRNFGSFWGMLMSKSSSTPVYSNVLFVGEKEILK